MTATSEHDAKRRLKPRPAPAARILPAGTAQEIDAPRAIPRSLAPFACIACRLRTIHAGLTGPEHPTSGDCSEWEAMRMARAAAQGVPRGRVGARPTTAEGGRRPRPAIRAKAQRTRWPLARAPATVWVLAPPARWPKRTEASMAAIASARSRRRAARRRPRARPEWRASGAPGALRHGWARPQSRPFRDWGARSTGAP